MPDLNKIYLYRMTHVDNIPHILNYGITHPSSPNANINYVAIGDVRLIITRNNFILDNGKKLGEYIPFYFAYKTPMLFKMQKEYNIDPASIVYCVVSVQKVIENQNDYIFTDGHAIEKFTLQHNPSQIDNINNLLDFHAIKVKYWKDENDLDLKRRKQSEFLLLGDIPINCILGYITYNQDSKDRLIDYGIEPSFVYVKSNYYF